MLAPRRHQGGVVIFYWESSIFAVEAIRQFGANVIACQLVTGDRHWYIFGCYLAPGDRAIIWDVLTGMNNRTRGVELIVAGGFNADL